MAHVGIFSKGFQGLRVPLEGVEDLGCVRDPPLADK